MYSTKVHRGTFSSTVDRRNIVAPDAPDCVFGSWKNALFFQRRNAIFTFHKMTRLFLCLSGGRECDYFSFFSFVIFLLWKYDFYINFKKL